MTTDPGIVKGSAARHQLRQTARPEKKGNDHDHQTTGQYGRGAAA